MIFLLQEMNKISKCLNSLLVVLHSFHPWCTFFRKVYKIKDYDFFKKKKMNLLIKVNMFSLVSVSKSESRLDHRKHYAFQANTMNELQYIQISNNNFAISQYHLTLHPCELHSTENEVFHEGSGHIFWKNP